MARLTKRERRKKAIRNALLAVTCVMRVVNQTLQLFMLLWGLIEDERRPRIRLNPNIYQEQIDGVNSLLRDETECYDQLRVNRHTFMTLCNLLRERGGLQASRNVRVVEKVAIFLWIISHHTKVRRTHFYFKRSEETISRHFNAVLLAILRLNTVLWQQPVPIAANEADDRWSCFEVIGSKSKLLTACYIIANKEGLIIVCLAFHRIV